MPDSLERLLENNRRWAETMVAQDRAYFERLTALQTPEFLWIGCSDSRVPANQITGLHPGEVFVHRNVANIVVDTDLNCLSVLQFGVEVLGVRHVIVCGHYGCGGVRAALHGERHGLLDNWLRRVELVRDRHAGLLARAAEIEVREDLLCELNVIEQVVNVCQTTVVRDAWRRASPLAVHGWIYRLRDGRLKDLGITINASSDVQAGRATALARLST